MCLLEVTGSRRTTSRSISSAETIAKAFTREWHRLKGAYIVNNNPQLDFCPESVCSTIVIFEDNERYAGQYKRMTQLHEVLNAFFVLHSCLCVIYSECVNLTDTAEFGPMDHDGIGLLLILGIFVGGFPFDRL